MTRAFKLSVLTLGALLATSAFAASATPPRGETYLQKVRDALAQLNGKPSDTLAQADASQQPAPVDAVKKGAPDDGKDTPADTAVARR